MNLVALVKLCQDLAGSRSRRFKIERTAQFLRDLSPDEIPAAVAFLTARPFPTSDPRVVDVSWATLAEAEASAGSPASAPSLTLLDVAAAFADIAAASGPGSRQAKGERLRDLLHRATADERRTIANILLGELRIGLHDGLVQDAIAQAVGADPTLVRRASLVLSDLAEVARIALAQGAEGLRQVGIRVGVPLLPMLAELARDFGEVFAAHGGRTALEFKYDGARIQVHKQGEAVRIWSRGLTDVTDSLPEIVEIARGDLRAETVIVDGEVVAVGADGRPLPFQELMRRYRRTHEIEETARQIPVALYLFDCLLVDDRSLIDEPAETRRAELHRITGGRYLARRVLASDTATAEALLKAALVAGHEGVMAKDPASPYAPGCRGKRWFKIKPAKTIDCVIVAADWGSGRRHGWLSNYHLAVADGTGGFALVGKTFKGLTDDEFRAMTARLQSLAIEEHGATVTVRPEVVVEVAYDEIQRSPRYPSGLALRFARIVRLRDDKSPLQTTTLAELRRLYDRQFASKSPHVSRDRGDSRSRHDS